MKNIIIIAAIFIIPLAIYSLINKNSTDITALAYENGKPTLMTFSSNMCMDCQKMKSVLKEIEPSYSDRVNFISVNATEKSRRIKDLVKKHKVVLVPTMIFMDTNNNEVNRIEGSVTKEELISEIEEIINE